MPGPDGKNDPRGQVDDKQPTRNSEIAKSGSPSSCRDGDYYTAMWFKFHGRYTHEGLTQTLDGAGFWAVGGVSSLVGAVSAGLITRRLGFGKAMITGFILYSASLLLIPLARGATLVAALLLIGQQTLGDGAATLYQINQVSLRQAITPETLLGRVNASVEFLKLGAALIGSLLGGLMGTAFGLRTTLVIGSLGSLLSTFWLVTSPISALRTLPSPLEKELK